MKNFVEQTCRKLDSISCDICGESCKKTCDNEHATIAATWGYDSSKDLTQHDIDLCEKCFDKTITFLRSIRVNQPSKDDPLDGFCYGE